MKENGSCCDLNHLDISSYVSLDKLFSYELKDFNGDISKWDTSNVISMDAMFKNSEFNGDISRWNVAKVENMYEMFHRSEFLGDLSSWDVGCVESMAHMFDRTNYRGDLSNWNVSNVRTTKGMFAHCGYDGDLSKWDVAQVRNMHSMLTCCDMGDISKWDVSSVTDFTTFMALGACHSDLGAWRIHPEARVDGMMQAAMLTGSFPRVPLHFDGGYVLPETYFGDLANNYTLEEAKGLVENKKWLDLYLKTTAPKGLGPLHLAKAATLKSKPAWMTTPEFKWVKDQHSVCLGLGMEPRESAKWMADAFATRGETRDAQPTPAFDFSSLQ